MRIAIAGVYLEANTFTPVTSGREAFVEMRGAELVDSYEWPERLGSLVEDVEWFGSLRAMGITAGAAMDPALFDAYVAEIVDDLERHGPFDGVYLDLHGALNVRGRFGAEEAFVREVRRVVGPDAVISASMDTHGNYSRELAELIDLAACHRHAPHIDTWQTRERAVRNLITVIDRGVRPHRAWARVPVLLPGERTSTVVEPARTLFGSLEPLIETHGVLDANLWIGFAWADEPRNAAAVLVTGDDPERARACAAEIARMYWDAREDFVIVAEHHGDWDAALAFAATAPTPVLLSDSGDNQTAGGSGDVTFALTAALGPSPLRESGRTVLFGGIVDAEAVDRAVAAGIGASAAFTVGGRRDARFGAPVADTWTVLDLIASSEDPAVIQGAALRGTHGIDVTVQRIPSAFGPRNDPARVKRRQPGNAWWPKAVEYDVVVVKNGYLFPAQAEIAASAFMALTPGATDLDHDRLEFRHAGRPLFPLDTAFDADLTPQLLPAVGGA